MTGPCEIATLLGDERLKKVEATVPLVTVVVTNCNYARYLHACLESIARQSYTNFKCVVVDDCSTDDSREVVSAFIASLAAQGRFSLVCHPTNGGQMAGFKTGLKHAEGPFLVYVDADDLLLEDFLEVHLRAHASYEPVAFTSSDQYQINGKGELLAGTHSDHKSKGEYRYIPGRPLHRPYWVWATTSSMMFRRAVLELVLPDDGDEYRICADNYLCHFANLVGNSLLIPTVHGCYRRHGGNHFSSNELVGGWHPTGDMTRHPKDHLVRHHIFTILCRRYESFSRQISAEGLIVRLAWVVGPFEMIRFRKLFPRNLPFRVSFLYSLFLRICQVFRRQVLIRERERLAFELGDRVDVLNLPGR